jgi:hypothetical protein
MDEATKIYLAILAAVVPLVTAIAVAVVNHFQQHRAAERARRADRISNMMQDLYGPLSFFVGNNEQLVTQWSVIDGVYQKVYEREWPPDEATQKTIETETMQTIDVKNTYGRRIRANNARMVRIIRDHYHLIHRDDVDVLQAFVKDWIRLKVEVKLPSRTKRHTDKLPIFDPVFNAFITKRCDGLRTELESLSGRRRSIWRQYVDCLHPLSRLS